MRKSKKDRNTMTKRKTNGKAKLQAIRTPQKTMCEPRCSGRVESSSFTRGTRHVMFLNITNGGKLG